jgi:hypothetical protein
MRTIESTKAGERTHISFDPIPCEGGGGIICLTIYPPFQFIDNEGFSVFVGGGGVGERETLAEAKTFLLEKAKETCENRIARAIDTIQHFRNQLDRLNTEGLQGETVKPN